MKNELINTITIIINNETLDRYTKHYFSLHPRARKAPIKRPIHESINQWMILKRMEANQLKQKWKDFIIWLVNDLGYTNMNIYKCKVLHRVHYDINRRRDVDNCVPKFILDGLVESGMLVDDDCKHLTRLSLECTYDKGNPYTEIIIEIQEFKEDNNE